MKTALSALALLLVALGAISAGAAPPEVPVAVVYQGVLLDNTGSPRTGNVDLKVRLFDAGAGGTLLYVQSYTAVALDAGTFAVVIGPTGAPSDPPATPLTTSLAAVFEGDLAATGPQRWIELQVGTSAALARTRLQSTPFALRSGSAETADFANEADTAANAAAVDGIPAEFVSQLWTYTNLDDNGPGNADPLEGLTDVDGDGRANFIDADNDGDGVDDAAEIAAGTHPNLSTPSVSALNPSRGLTFAATLVTFTSAGLQPGFTATLGPLTLAPVNVLPTSFQASVAGLPAGSRLLTVSNPNGQTRQYPNAFIHADALPGGGGLDLFGGQQVLLGGGGYRVSTDGDFYTDLAFSSLGGSFRWDAAGRVAGLACGSPCQIQYVRDADGDFDLADETPVALESVTNVAFQSPSLAFDGSGRPGGGYVKRIPATGQGIPVVFHDRNGDGTFGGANERIELAALATSPAAYGEAAFDPSGRLAYVYGQDALANNLVVAYDRNGDGDFADALESTVVSFGVQPQCMGATFDGGGHLALVHGTGSSVQLRRDLNDDGDFADALETSSLPGSSGCDVASGPGVDFAVSRAEAADLRIYRDLNGDRDFADANESVLLVTLDNPQQHSMRIGPNARAFVGTLTELAIMAP